MMDRCPQLMAAPRSEVFCACVRCLSDSAVEPILQPDGLQIWLHFCVICHRHHICRHSLDRSLENNCSLYLDVGPNLNTRGTRGAGRDVRTLQRHRHESGIAAPVSLPTVPESGFAKSESVPVIVQSYPYLPLKHVCKKRVLVPY